jgi:alpha-1,6-mannosyltransferase
MPYAWLVACAAFLVALSWIRPLVVGHPSPDHGPLPFPLDVLGATGFVAIVLLALGAHLRRSAQAAGSVAAGSRELAREALGLVLLASAMLPLLSGDLFSVLAYAELLVKPSVDPFTLPAPGLSGSSFLPFLSPRWRETPCLYGPLQLLFWSPAARFGASLPAALAVAKLLAAVAAATTLALLRRHCSGPEGPGPAAFAAVALSPVLWVEGAGQAHGDVLVGLLFAAWLLAARRSGVVLASALLGAAVASKLTAALPAGMYLAYLAGRPGPWPARLGRAAAAASVLGLVVALAYWPFWSGLDTLRVPLTFLAERRPTNSLGEIVFVAIRPVLGSAVATAALASLGTLLTAGLALVGAVLAFRAPGLSALAGAMAGVSLLAATLAAPVFHPWYLIPCLVLSVELRDPVWQAWLLRFGTVSLLADGSVLLAYGSLPRAVYTVLAVSLVAGASLLGIRTRLRRLLDLGTGVRA